MPKLIETKAEFDQALKDAGNKLVAVDFTASWCGPCQMIGPKFAAMSEEFTDVIFLKVDVDENTETAEAYDVQAMPTFKFFKNGKVIAEVVGSNEAKLRSTIEANK